VFSSSKVMLGLVQRLLGATGTKHLRIDGDVSDMRERARMVDAFNADESIQVCLLTTGVGALGLTLTGASRVVILDPSWNPSTDAQAVDRAYRMGQTRDVVTYRCIACGSMEERQYRLQVFKGGVPQSVLGHGGGGEGGSSHSGKQASSTSRGGYQRYLTRSELRDMFRLGSIEASETAQLLDETRSAPPAPPADSALGAHLLLVQQCGASDSLVALSRHDHLYALEAGAAASLARRLQAALTPAGKKAPRPIPHSSGSSANDYRRGGSMSSCSPAVTPVSASPTPAPVYGGPHEAPPYHDGGTPSSDVYGGPHEAPSHHDGGTPSSDVYGGPHEAPFHHDGGTPSSDVYEGPHKAPQHHDGGTPSSDVYGGPHEAPPHHDGGTPTSDVYGGPHEAPPHHDGGTPSSDVYGGPHEAPPHHDGGTPSSSGTQVHSAGVSLPNPVHVALQTLHRQHGGWPHAQDLQEARDVRAYGAAWLRALDGGTVGVACAHTAIRDCLQVGTLLRERLGAHQSATAVQALAQRVTAIRHALLKFKQGYN
jgi:hypothetical protein